MHSRVLSWSSEGECGHPGVDAGLTQKGSHARAQGHGFGARQAKQPVHTLSRSLHLCRGGGEGREKCYPLVLLSGRGVLQTPSLKDMLQED